MAEPRDLLSEPVLEQEQEQEQVSGPIDFVVRHSATSPEFDPNPDRELQPAWLAPRDRMPVRNFVRGRG